MNIIIGRFLWLAIILGVSLTYTFAQSQQELNAEINTATREISAKPRDPRPLYARASAYLKLGDYNRAITDYNKLMELLPTAGEILVQRGFAHYLRGDLLSSMNDVEKGIKMGKLMYPPDPYYLRGFLHLQKGDFIRATSDLKRALQLGSKTDLRDYFFDLRLTPEKIIADIGNLPSDKEKAAYALIDLYEKYEKYESGKDLRTKRFLVAFTSKYFQAISSIKVPEEELEEMNEYIAERYFDRGKRYVELGWWDLGIADLSKAMALDPALAADSHKYRGHAHRGKGQFNEAIADFSAELRLFKGPPLYAAGTLLARADSYIWIKRTDLAMADLNKIISTVEYQVDAKVMALVVRHDLFCAAGKKAEAAADARTLSKMGKPLRAPCR